MVKIIGGHYVRRKNPRMVYYRLLDWVWPGVGATRSGPRLAVDKFGTIDVLVNNAGYGYQSAVEEGVEEEIRAQFDTNVFGLFALTRAVLPLMRAQRQGHVINITSVAGLVGFPGSGYYAASKHAVEGWSDALWAEGAPLGIKVTCVEPGPFRTDWAGRSLRQTPNALADYATTAAARMKTTAANSGKQAGDPVRAADAMLDITLQGGRRVICCLVPGVSRR